MKDFLNNPLASVPVTHANTHTHTHTVTHTHTLPSLKIEIIVNTHSAQVHFFITHLLDPQSLADIILCFSNLHISLYIYR